MRTEIKLEDKIRIEAPCSASWEEMKGGEQKRFCEGCGLHVHNLSAMTRRDAHNLLQANPDRLCIRYGQRPDGAIVTDNCPPRLRPARALLLKRFTAIASFGLLLFNLTCQTARAMQKTQSKANSSKAANKDKHTRPAANGRTFLGRRVLPPAAPAAPTPLMGKPGIEQDKARPLALKGHTADAGSGKTSVAADAATKYAARDKAAKDKDATVFTTGVGVRF